MKVKSKITAIILGAMILSNIMPVTTAWAAEGSTFTSVTADGHELIYKVLTEDSKTNTGTVQVGEGEYGYPAISGFGSGSLTIPQTVMNDGITYTVTSIGDYAFYRCNFTGDLTIPDNVQTIGDLAFSECIGFNGSLTIGNNVETIGNHAFYCGKFVGSLDIPNNVTSIGESAFENCSEFTGSLTIGNSVQTIGNSAFGECYNFTGNLVIPDSVTSIGESAFFDCNGFYGSLTIGESVESIGADAFYFCYHLSGNLIIPNSVTTIGKDAFYFCCNFTGDLTIPGNIETISDEAFMNCYGFNGSLTIEDGVQNIGQSAFQSCSGFTGSLTIPDSVTSIGSYAFFSNSGLDGKLILGNKVDSIGERAFSDCVNLGNAWFLGDKPAFGSGVFDNCQAGFTIYYPENNSTWDGYIYDGADPINIEASSAPIITTVNLPYGTLGEEYEYSLTATGNEPIVWILSGGSLPDGIDLESDGDLSGTPSAVGTFNFTVMATNASGNDTKALSIVIIPAAPATTYTVTATADSGGGISPNGSVSVTEGSNQTFAITPNSGYRISSVTVDGVGQGAISTYTFTNVTSAHTINATFTGTGGDSDSSDSGSSSSGGGSRSGGSSTSSTPNYNAGVKAGNGFDSTLPITVDTKNGTASVGIGSQKLTSGETAITIPPIPNVDTYSVGIPVPELSSSGGQGSLTLNTGAGSITVPSNMLTGVSGISGSKVEISIGQGDKDNLPENVRAAIGDRPLIQLTLSVDGKQTGWNNPDAPVTVSIPYKPTAAELANQESIVIWYIDGSGNIVTIPNGLYDPETGSVTFTATHFSLYAVAYNKVSFNDVVAGAWYSKAVSFIAARGITTGISSGNFSPQAKLTRGEFLVMLMRAYGVEPDISWSDNFADAGNTYYTGYLAVAKRLGISGGVGSNLFAPEKEITRQEMFTLLYNALKATGELPRGNSGKQLSSFSDAEQVASWAKDAMTLFAKSGIIGGSGGKLAPASMTTRAEMAQVLYNLMSK